MEPPFERTVCACAECVKCCTSFPGHMVPGDWERIAKEMGVTVEAAAQFFERGKGAIVGMPTTTGTLVTLTIPTLRPKFVEGRCIFLTPENQCQVHAVAPFGCAYFDMHMGRLEGNNRMVWGLSEIVGDKTYEKRWEEMPPTKLR